MDDEGFDAERLAEAMAPLLGLQMTPVERPGVVLHLRTTRGLALTVMRFPLPERIENAPVFRS